MIAFLVFDRFKKCNQMPVPSYKQWATFFLEKINKKSQLAAKTRRTCISQGGGGGGSS